jgi:hypothetical protein
MKSNTMRLMPDLDDMKDTGPNNLGLVAPGVGVPCTTSNKHTPLPWRFGDNVGKRPTWEYVEGQDGQAICLIGQTSDGEANAAFIVRACNAHEDLVAALSELVELLEDNQPDWYLKKHFNHARAALAKAEGK